MSLFLERSLTSLRDRLLTLCASVEGRVQDAVRALAGRDVELAKRVIDGDTDIDQAELKLEEDCLKVLALYQPVAGDLRLIIAFLKINNDVERIADLAVHIAERAIDFAARPVLEPPVSWYSFSAKVQKMLRHSIDAVVQSDPDLAREVMASDGEVDALHRRVYQWVCSSARQKPDEVDSLLDALAVSRYLERIADHATNIAEDTVYLFTGEIVRHRDSIARAPHTRPPVS
jgi:phosphate transport system protein